MATWLTAFGRDYYGSSNTSGTSGTSGEGGTPPPPPPPAPASCTINTAYQPYWHNSAPWGSTNSASDMKAYLETNFTTPTTFTNWSDVAANGSMAWISIGQSSNYASSDTYLGEDYYIRMVRNDGDGVAQNTPLVAGGGSSPNQLYLEELDSAGVKTGDTITFQCIEDGTTVPGTFGTQFIFKARVTARTGFGTSSINFNNNSWYLDTDILDDFCTTWSSVTPLTTCDPITNLTSENEHTTDFVYPSSVSSNPLGGGGAGGI